MSSRVSALLLLAVGGLGGWFLHELRGSQTLAQDAKVEPPAKAEAKPAEPVAGPEHPLDTLDWLVGDWIDNDDKMSVEFSCHYTKNRAFLLRSFRVLEGETVKQSGMQIVGWDATLGTIRSWTYDSEGGFGEEIWSQTDGRYTLRSTYTMPDGSKGSALSTLSYIDDNTCTWKSVNREIDGELQSDVDEYTLVKKQPPVEPKTEEPKKEGK